MIMRRMASYLQVESIDVLVDWSFVIRVSLIQQDTLFGSIDND